LSLDVLAALALAVEDMALEHSLAMCPVLPQKRQRHWLKRCLCSSLVSLPSFPSLVERSEDPFRMLEVLGLEFEFGAFLSLELELELGLPLLLGWSFSSLSAVDKGNGKEKEVVEEEETLQRSRVEKCSNQNLYKIFLGNETSEVSE